MKRFKVLCLFRYRTKRARVGAMREASIMIKVERMQDVESTFRRTLLEQIAAGGWFLWGEPHEFELTSYLPETVFPPLPPLH
jgi:hypothetical protein